MPAPGIPPLRLANEGDEVLYPDPGFPMYASIADIAQRHDLAVLSDEVYWAIRYDGEHAGVLDVDGMADRTILLDGWSKTFAMTGWRLGFGVFPPALEGSWQPVQEMVAEFGRRRDIIVAGLNDIPGISCLTPQGAFYVFPDITGTGLNATELQARLLRDAGVAPLAGSTFGPCGEGFLRLSYANSAENIRAAVEAIRA